MKKINDIPSLYALFTEHPVVTTDTRQCEAGSIFFALKGANFNGNAFALQALEAGCAYAVVDEVTADDDRLLVVDDVLATLQELARYHRRKLGTPILQITGTNGKTTTKELTAAVLGERYRVLWTQGNLNNHIGVPRTLLRLTNENDIAVVETGANHPGEIAFLSRLVDADSGLITNVGEAHLEGFGSLEGVVRTKTELYDYLTKKAATSSDVVGPDTKRDKPFVFVHGDNETLMAQATVRGLDAITYGAPGAGHDFEGEVVECNPFVRIRWRQAGEPWNEVQTQLIGAYNIDNILAAATVGVTYGVTPLQVNHALAAYHPTNSRSEYRETGRNRLIVDAYNANVSSMRAALTNFAAIADDHKVLILGEMRELGAASAVAHQEIAARAVATGCEALWLVGHAFDDAEPLLHAALQQGALGAADGAQPAEACDALPEVRRFADVEAVKVELDTHPLEGCLVMIKGSNGTKLWQLPELL